MNDPTDADLQDLDQAARAASRGLHDHVSRRVDPELVLASLPTGEAPRRHGRLLAAAAVAALFVGSVAVLGDGPGGDDRSRLELDEDGNKLPTPEPGSLTPLGPNDGRDSIQLPVTVEPNADLQPGQVITVSGPGFVPGERVGIVQCASEAGADNGGTREERAGIEACDTGGVSYADANADGLATGTFTVQRVLTTPSTGSVDCATEANRCIVAMGALDDYDRSGGFGVTFAGGGEPVDIPTVTVTPADGLADGDVVHVEGAGFEPGQLVTLTVCSIDPAGCWYTGEELTFDGDEIRELGLDERYGDGEYLHVGLATDGEGRIRGDVPVWRYLPTATPGTYVDCAVSACTLRISAESGLAPVPPPLGFLPGGSGPRPPAVAVDPTTDLAPGDDIVVRGAGFQPGAFFYVSLCAAPAGDPTMTYTCSGGDGEHQIDDDGGFAIEFEVPDLQDQFEETVTTACAGGGSCPSTSVAPGTGACDGVQIICSIRVESYGPEGGQVQPPQFPAVPVQVTLRG